MCVRVCVWGGAVCPCVCTCVHASVCARVYAGGMVI